MVFTAVLMSAAVRARHARYLGVKTVLMIVVGLVVCWVMWVMQQIKAFNKQSGVVRASW